MKKIKYKTLQEGFELLENNEMFTFIEDDESEIEIRSSEFKSKVRKILFYLQSRGIRPGCELVFQIKKNIDFMYLFWACVLGKIIPVPFTYLEKDRDRMKIINIWNTLKNPYLVTDLQSFRKLESVISDCGFNEYESIKSRLILIENIPEESENGEIVFSNEQDIAFIQFSSGSTNEPKGVMVSHKNIIASINATIDAMQVCENDIYLSWLPLTHSFGLIGTYLTPLMMGCKFYIMSSKLFVVKPLLWIKKLSEHKVTITASPNFGLKRVCKYWHLTNDNTIDLSSLRIIIDGAEPVAADVCQEFADKMSAVGMKDTVIRPSYGMSETTLVISTPRTERKFIEVCTVREQVRIGEEIIEAKKNIDNIIRFVEVGECLEIFKTKIVDDDYNEVGEQVVGTLLLKGDAVFSGYYNNPEATKWVFDEDGWFNTGDLGFMKDGKLILTGRAKDLIFINGENYYSYDIERICEEIEDKEIGKVAVCGVYNNKIKQEILICFIEFTGNQEKFEDISLKMKKQVIKKAGVGIAYFIPVNEIPVTVSGKIKRYLLKDQFDRGEYDEYIRKGKSNGLP